MKNNGLSHNDLYHCSKDDVAKVITKRLMMYVNCFCFCIILYYYYSLSMIHDFMLDYILDRNWEKEKKKKNPNFAWVMFRTYATSYIFPIFIYMFEECFLRIVQPLMLGRVIRYFSDDPSVTYEWACIYCGGVCMCTFFFISLHHPTMLQVMRIGMRLRVASCSLMYQKALRLSRASVGQTAVGQIVNIMSNDVNRFDEFSLFVAYLLVSPIQTAIVVYIVWTYLGVSCLVGIGLLLLFIPFQGFMGKMFSKVRSRIALLTDARLRYMSEIISGMRVIKMYSWELPFSERVSDARK